MTLICNSMLFSVAQSGCCNDTKMVSQKVSRPVKIPSHKLLNDVFDSKSRTVEFSPVGDYFVSF